MSDVVFRCIPGFPTYYRVGDDGSVWTCARGPWRLIKNTNEQDGYLKVHLMKDPSTGERASWRVHRVVLTAFVGPRPVGMEARHLDSDKHNNRLSNLAWGTPEENFRDRMKRGTVITRENSRWRRLDETQVRAAIESFKSGVLIKDIACSLGVDASHVSKILHGEEWKGVGDAPLAGRDARQRGALIREQRKREAYRCA